jgi:hypothetical protein
MPRKRISMRKIKEVLRLKFEGGLTYDAIGRSCNIGHTTVGEYLKRAQEAGLRWPLPADMDDNLLWTGDGTLLTSVTNIKIQSTDNSVIQFQFLFAFALIPSSQLQG